MNQFIERYNLSKFTQEEIDNLSGPISVLKNGINTNLPKQKVPGPDGFTGEFYQTVKK